MAISSQPFDPNPSLRAELTAALAVLAPQIQGLQHLEMVSAIPTDLVAEFRMADAARTRRRDLILAVIEALDDVVQRYLALIADGYPTLDPVPLLPTTLDELIAERAALEAAIDVFEAGAVQIAGDPASITFVDQPSPPP